jgi:sarcosine oxidase subunit alpha
VSGARHHLKRVRALVGGRELSWNADLLAVSGGFVPVVHLHMQAGGKLAWDEAAQAFTPGATAQDCATIGAAAAPPPAASFAPAGSPKQSFVDFQNDVTLSDIDLAWQEGYRSVEHLKRYTTLGMATDQGKTSNMTALSRLAEKQGIAVPDAGLTTFRPPYTPMTMGTLAGPSAHDAGAHVRRLALYDAHARRAPLWQPVGYWFRPRAYPLAGETLAVAALREASAVRSRVGLTDVSTLAKFEVTGPDAATLLELVCATTVSKLAPGRGRYTFMLREDGMVFDDGTVWRIAPDRYLLTSSTGGADRMAAHISYVRNVLRPDMRVSAVNVQEHYAAIALAGPRARAVIEALIRAEPPRHMSSAPAMLARAPVLVLAASYSGERAFEIYVEATQTLPVWTALRVEKGHILVGGEIDGRTTPHDLGLDAMLNKAGGFIGAAGLIRPALSEPGRLQLVGVQATSGRIAEGAMLVELVDKPPQGHVTAVGQEGAIGLALLADGHSRHGEELVMTSPTRGLLSLVNVVAPHFYDPAGERYRD